MSSRLWRCPAPGDVVVDASPEPVQQPKRQARFSELNTFVDRTMSNLTPTEAMIWLALFRNCRNGVCRVGRKRLAGLCGMSEKTVSRCITELTAKGLVRRIGGGTTGKLSKYRVWATLRRRTGLGTSVSRYTEEGGVPPCSAEAAQGTPREIPAQTPG